ncbi:MAG: TonB-dependent receptor [Saprospiraceae bacterium]|nr:TonB-dependent receptor [Saprospiraceae bacterium]
MKLYLSIFLFLVTLSLHAQVRVSGVVTDATSGEALIGVSVAVKGTNLGAITDVNGAYTLNVPEANALLIFSYTGYASQEIALNGRSTLDLKLGVSENLLNEIVVVGYGTQKKSDHTGSVGSVKAKDIQRIATGSVDQALQGKIAGVYVTPISGQPGAGAVIRIRGTGTLNNANPLYVVDGMLLDDASFINPQDVESVEVLKDASATAIYGNRGANGVIIITTKRGNMGDKALINFSSYYGSQQLTRQIDMANASQFAQMYNELSGQTYFPDPSALGEGTNWQDVIYRDAPIASAQISANGGSEKFLYNISANYFNQEGIQRESEFTRVTLRLNNEYQISKFLRLGNNIAFMGAKSQEPAGVALSTLWMPPVYAERDSLGKFSDPTFFGTSIGNPAADVFYRKNNFSNGARLVGTMFADITFLKYFTFRTNIGLNFTKVKNRFFLPPYEVSVSQRNINDQLSLNFYDNTNWLWENTLNFNKEWGSSKLNVLAGYTAQESHFEEYGASRSNFPSAQNELLYLTAGNDTTQMNYGRAGEWAMVSYLGRVNFTLLDRFLFTASLRADGSSRFAASNRWGYFPSFAFGWNIAQEPFMSRQHLLDRLKLRASWGIVGNDKTQLYPSLGVIQGNLYSVFGPGETLNTGATLTTQSNANVRWEEATQTDIGLEAAILQGRFSVEVDWYNRLTRDILYELPIPDYVGSAGNPVVNVADVRNRGWDFTLNWRETRQHFSYSLGAILSTVNNEVVQLDERKSEVSGGGTASGDQATLTRVGRSIGDFYGFQVAGIFQNADEIATLPRLGDQKPGDFRYRDVNSDGVINDDDKVYLGSPIPTITYGFNAGIEFAGIDLTADFFGVSGNKVVNARSMSRFGVYNWETTYFNNRWTGEGTSNTVPRVSNGGVNYRMSDFYVQDGSFFRLRSLAIGYTLPRALSQRAGISKLRVYASGTNLWTKQQYTGYSPEFAGENVFSAGIDYGNYPIAKVMLAGIELTF